jgi:hypothetical protein
MPMTLLSLCRCIVAGNLPPSLAKLDTLVELFLYDNNLQGALPPHIGSPMCLASLMKLNVSNNKQLGGVLEASFLFHCTTCETKGTRVG